MLSRGQVFSFIPAIMVIPILLLTGCHRLVGRDAAEPAPGVVRVEEIHGDGLVQVDQPDQFLLSTVERRPTVDQLQVTGVVTPDVSRAVPVLSLAGGRAVDIRVKLGDQVAKDQVLLVINSPDVAQAFADYERFQADEILSGQQLARAQDLFAHGAMAKQELEASENAARKAQADLRAARQHIAILGADLDKPSPLVAIRAPISGVIVEQNVTSGAGVRSLDNSPNLFTIADLSTVWVLCDVYENDVSRVHLGDSAEVRLNAYPDHAFTGRVGNIGSVLDPTTRTAKVRLEIANSGSLMRAGMFATAVFQSSREQLRPVIPTSAIMRLHDKDWVFVPLGGKRFRRLAVQTGPVYPDGFQVVLSGLTEGSKVVTNALQFASAAGME
jgi:cobalt-zinc-cadmium efflux system membrane fusion protein